jgi:hypothetical protein
MENGMGKKCSTHDKNNILCENRKERTTRRHRRAWEDIIKLNFREIGWGDMDWINLAQDRDQWQVLVNRVMKLRVAYNSGKFLSSCATVGLSRTQIYEVNWMLSVFG